MRKTVFLFLVIMCFTVISVSAQIAGSGRSNFKSLTGASAEADLKNDSNFRAKIELDAADIEKQARLINLLEIHNLLAEQMPRVETWKRPFAPEMGEELVSRLKVGQRQGNHPFSIEEGGDTHILEIMGHFRIIPRNDFLSNPLPVPRCIPVIRCGVGTDF